MWPAEITVVALAFLGVTLMAFGIFGRPTHASPRCRACGADVRALAWSDEPTCGCGRRLDRPGAVHSRGRERRPRIAIAGVLFWVVGAGLAAETIRLRTRNQSWIAWVPSSIVVARAEAGDEWAVELLNHDEISPALAGETLLRIYGGATFPKVSTERLLSIWRRERPNAQRVGDAFIRRLNNAALIADDDSAVCLLSTGSLPAPSSWLVRIEEVESEGKPVAWTLSAMRPPFGANAGERVFVGGGVVQVRLPESVPPGTPLTIKVVLVQSEAAEALPLMPELNSDAPPSTWPIEVTRFEGSFTCTPLAFGRSVPDDGEAP